MGRGTITSAGPGRWKLRVRAGTDPITGQPKRLSKTITGSRKDADELLVDLIREADIARDRARPETVTVNELADRWLAHKYRTISPRTVLRYTEICDLHIRPTLGAQRVDRLRGRDIDRLYEQLEDRGVGTGTITAVHRVVRAMFNQAIRWEHTTSNPAIAATPPKHRARKINPPGSAEFLAGLQHLTQLDPDLAVYAAVASSTGARRGEMCALRWTDIDQINGAITISGSVTKDAKGDWIRATTKTGVVHTVAIGPGILAQLTAMRRRHTGMCELVDIEPSDYVFQADPVAPVDPPRPDTWTARWTRRRAEIGLESVRLHDLRHYTATMLLAAGVDPVTVAGRLGHSNPAITMKVYAAFLPEKDREAANILDTHAGSGPRLEAVPD